MPLTVSLAAVHGKRCITSHFRRTSLTLLVMAILHSAQANMFSVSTAEEDVSEYPATVKDQDPDSQIVSSFEKNEHYQRRNKTYSSGDVTDDNPSNGIFSAKVGSKFSRIVNGEDVNITEVPYQVALEYESRFACGGSVISELWVLTAAHCFERPFQPHPGKWRVRLGATLRQKGGRLVKVKTVTQHPRYHGRGWDVAVLRLAERASLGDAVQPVRLSPKSKADPETGSNMTISGWGATASASIFLPNKLQRAKVQIIDRKDCSVAYGGLDLSPMRPDEICAGGNKKDACQGDSGGAMVDDSGVQVGIVSWGEGCASYPGVYTKVANADIRDFINKNTGV